MTDPWLANLTLLYMGFWMLEIFAKYGIPKYKQLYGHSPRGWEYYRGPPHRKMVNLTFSRATPAEQLGIR